MSVLNYNNKYFPNIELAAAKSEAAFVEHEKHTGLTEAELKEAHALCVAAVEPKDKPAKPGK
jgi:hypothetical protein